MPKVAPGGKAVVIEACERHAVGSTCFDVDCQRCQLKCRGEHGCGLWLPLADFRKQHRVPRKSGKPDVLGPALWKPTCAACTARVKNPVAERQRAEADRNSRIRLASLLLQPGVKFFVIGHGEHAVKQYENNEWAKLLERRKAEVHHNSVKELYKVPSHHMLPAIRKDATKRAQWMLDFCEWQDPEMQALATQIEYHLRDLKAARDGAARLHRVADWELEKALDRLDPRLLAAITEAACSKTFCAAPSEMGSLLANRAWVDHRVSLIHDEHLPQLTAFTAAAIEEWIGGLNPSNIQASWLQDGVFFCAPQKTGHADCPGTACVALPDGRHAGRDRAEPSCCVDGLGPL